MKITELAYLESCVNQGKEKTQKVRYLKQVIMSKFKNNFHCNLRYAKNFPLSYNFTVGHQVSQRLSIQDKGK